ncbi:GNAT family N-acetyltransferase [Arthrobacter sp. SD76]|uniref:GNAT family N-acetyltransferase n=1 Tax=Arthrobacter sp. SD76 TaxID=3415007 RepID=UPI003C70D3E9
MATGVTGIHAGPAGGAAAWDVEAAMDAAWPAMERHSAGGWVFRAAGGVTQRANSIWPRHPGGTEVPPALLRDARAWYRARRLPVIFQVPAGARTAALDEFLDAEGFTRQSETLIMTRGPLPDAHTPEASVEIRTDPSADWLNVWWTVDGRGGADALATATDILKGCPSLYALVRDDAGRPAAVGRLAIPAGDTAPRGGDTAQRGGIYCMATLPDARGRGYGTAVLRALLHAGSVQGLDGYWLLVTVANRSAQELYARAGFRETGRYLYRQERPRHALTGC